MKITIRKAKRRKLKTKKQKNIKKQTILDRINISGGFEYLLDNNKNGFSWMAKFQEPHKGKTERDSLEETENLEIPRTEICQDFGVSKREWRVSVLNREGFIEWQQRCLVCIYNVILWFSVS